MSAPPFPAGFGILGGMGPQATHYFTGEVLSAIERYRKPSRDQEYPNFMVRYACHMPDRTAALLADREPLIAAFAREAQSLVGLGCTHIVIPCVTAHALLDGDSVLAELPFIDIRVVVAEHIARTFPDAKRIGVLCTRGARMCNTTLAFAPAGCEAVHLEPVDERELMTFIYDQAKTWTGARDLSTLARLRRNLVEQGCDVVIAGCTELEMSLARSDAAPDEFIYPLQTVARQYAPIWCG